jgi:hypothetical protein
MDSIKKFFTSDNYITKYIPIEYLIIIIISIIYLSLLIVLYKPATSPNVKENFQLNLIDLDFIKEFTKTNSLYRPVTSNNLETVKNNTIHLLNQIPNFIVSEQYFTRGINNKEYSFSNIIANPSNFNKGKPYIILSAHIDGPTTLDNCPASIDAITSIGIIIELAKQLAKNAKNVNNYNFQVVFFDGEEAIDGPWSDSNTLSGSKYFVKHLDSKPVQVFVFDLIGADIDKNKLFAFSSNPKSHLLMSKLAWTNNSLYPENKRIFIDPNETISYSIIKDDSVPFFKANIPVIDLIPPTFPSTHHTVGDNYSNVNWDYIDIFSNVIYNYLLNNPVHS